MGANSHQQDYALAIRAVGMVRAAPVVYDVTGPSIEIGSAEDNHIVLNGPGVEPHHLMIRQTGSRLYVLVDQAAAHRHNEEIWLNIQPDDTLYCPHHGRLATLIEPGRCPHCSEVSNPLWLRRPLNAGDVFSIGTAFEATVLSQGKANTALSTTPEALFSHWPNTAWLENPPRPSPSIRVGQEPPPPAERPYPLEDSNLWVWAPSEAPIPVFMHQQVNRYVTRHATSNGDREVGGLLLGEVFLEPEDRVIYPVITHALAARYATEARGHLTFTHATWLDLTRQREDYYPDKRVLGWYHTHPGLDIFLSEMDLFIHRNFFRDPWQVALVIDPRQDLAGFFVWAGSDVLDPQQPYQLFKTAELEELPIHVRPQRIRIKLGERIR